MSGDEEIQNTGASASQQPLLPAGLSMPKALEGNVLHPGQFIFALSCKQRPFWQVLQSTER